MKRKSKKSSQFSSMPLPVILIAVLLIVIILKLLASGNNTLGITTYLAKGDDSGSSGSGSDSSGSNSSGSGSSGNSDSGSSGSGSSGSSDSNSNSGNSGVTETRTENGVRTQTEAKQDETRTEVRLSEEERIRTRTKDGQTRIDITSGGIKTRLEIRDDRMIIKAEQEDGTEVELEDNTIFKIEERLGISGIKIATAGAEKFIIQRGTTGAITDFPLSIDLVTNMLTVNTPAGQKTVTVLPDQAVQNLIATNVVNRIGGQAVADAVLNNNLSSVSQIITLSEQNGVPVYEINGISDQKLLGFIPVSIDKKVDVSAESGEVISTDISLGDRILDLLSF
ncbi:MAG: hypothetical protein HYW62_04470 [Candidatus Levybacteria bacterium]|nr:hypothetical protein [Candidatus Levybacteria bacterium]